MFAVLLSNIAIANQHFAENIIQKDTREGVRVHIDVTISQPNINDCYVTSIPEMIIEEDWITVYPNPNQGEFNIDIREINAGENIVVSIYCPSGQRVYIHKQKAKGENLTLQLNLSHLNKGLYIIHIRVNKKVISRKLTII
jgi:hypothetical protein